MREYLPVLAIYLGVDQLAYANLIVVEEVARRVLEVPFDLAGVDVEGEGRVGEQVVTGTVFRIVHRHRLPCAPIRQLGGRVVGTGLPERAAAMQPRAGVALPGVTAGLIRSGNAVGPPHMLTGIG